VRQGRLKDLARNSIQKKAVYFLRLMVCATLLSYVFIKYDAVSVFLHLLNAKVYWLIVAAVFMFTARFLSSLKWRSILYSYGHRASLLHLYKLYIESGFFNLLFPGFVAGDISRIARTSADGLLSVKSVLAVFLERLSGLVLLLFYISVVAFLGGYEALGQVWGSVILLTVLLPLAAIVLFLNMQCLRRAVRVLPRFLRYHVEKTAEKIHDAINRVTSHPTLLWKLTILSLVFILLMVGAAYCVSRSINFLIPPHVLLAYVPLIALLANLPISIMGIGVRESLAVFFYSALGYLPEEIIAFALLQSALFLTLNLIGGVVLLLRSTQSYSKSQLKESIHRG